VCLSQPGHWLGPVARPGWLGSNQPVWTESDPTQKKLKKKSEAWMGLVPGPASPICFRPRMYLAKHTFMSYLFYSTSFYFVI